MKVQIENLEIDIDDGDLEYMIDERINNMSGDAGQESAYQSEASSANGSQSQSPQQIREVSIMIFTGDDIRLYRLHVLRAALELEIKGLKRSRGPTAYSIAKSEFGFRGNRQKVLDQLTQYTKEQVAQREPQHA
jgi:hypothetical protein